MISKTILMERYFREGGMETFSDEEAVGLLLEMAGCPGDRDILAGKLIERFGSLKGVLEAREEQLRGVRGIGKRTSGVIRMVLPFCRKWEQIGRAHV